MIVGFLFVAYGWLVLVAATNLALMAKPRGRAEVLFEVRIPARNEADNLPKVIPPLEGAGVRVVVFDDDSCDGTAQVARSLEAEVIAGEGGPPEGWTGKTRACHRLAEVGCDMPWVLFLDSDTVPTADFARAFSSFLASRPAKTRCVTGFPRMVPGRGLEPAYIGWVTWILLATNPFGWVARIGMGHNYFTNGQVVAWRTDFLEAYGPYAKAKGEVLEDVKIGRRLAKDGIRVETANLSEVLGVRMYEDLASAFNGMAKNSADVAGGTAGSLAFAGLLLVLGWGWAFAGPYAPMLFGALILSKILVDLAVRHPLWCSPLIPFTCLAGAATVLTAAWRRKTGRRAWKGRALPPA